MNNLVLGFIIAISIIPTIFIIKYIIQFIFAIIGTILIIPFAITALFLDQTTYHIQEDNVRKFRDFLVGPKFDKFETALCSMVWDTHDWFNNKEVDGFTWRLANHFFYHYGFDKPDFDPKVAYEKLLKLLEKHKYFEYEQEITKA